MPLFSSFSFSLQQICTDWPKFLVKFSIFVRLDKCSWIQTHWRNIRWQMFIPNKILCVKTLHGICFRGSNNDGSRWTNKLEWCFSWCKLNIIHGVPQGWDLLIVINIFRSKNVVLFAVITIHCIRKSTKNRNSETGLKQHKIQD